MTTLTVGAQYTTLSAEEIRGTSLGLLHLLVPGEADRNAFLDTLVHRYWKYGGHITVADTATLNAMAKQLPNSTIELRFVVYKQRTDNREVRRGYVALSLPGHDKPEFPWADYDPEKNMVAFSPIDIGNYEMNGLRDNWRLEVAIKGMVDALDIVSEQQWKGNKIKSKLDEFYAARFERVAHKRLLIPNEWFKQDQLDVMRRQLVGHAEFVRAQELDEIVPGRDDRYAILITIENKLLIYDVATLDLVYVRTIGDRLDVAEVMELGRKFKQ